MLEDPKNLARVLGPRVGVKALIHRDGALLFNHSRAQREDGTVEEWYDLPGGGQEYGESQADALRRECVEEIGARVRVYQIATVFEFATGAQTTPSSSTSSMSATGATSNPDPNLVPSTPTGWTPIRSGPRGCPSTRSTATVSARRPSPSGCSPIPPVDPWVWVS
jgi:ADP-ribose pyrophosphatase YjhB (NUDIX family)